MMIENQTIFITGGAGFIGSTVIGRLVESNRIVVFDNMARNSLQSKPYADHPNITVIQGDVLDSRALTEAMNGADIVLHCAAIAGIDTVVRSPVTTMKVNMIGSANVLEAAAGLGTCKRAVCFSTSEVFGARAFRVGESDGATVGETGKPRWTYAVSKLAEEHLTLAYHRETGLPGVVLRPFNVYGPGQVGEGALRIFIQRALAGETIQIRGDGAQIRSWCYVDDMIQGLLLAMSKPEAVGQTFNIGNPRASVTIYGLAERVVQVLNSSSKIEFTPAQGEDVELRIPSIANAERLLGYSPTVDLDEGIRRTAEFYASNS